MLVLCPSVKIFLKVKLWQYLRLSVFSLSIIILDNLDKFYEKDRDLDIKYSDYLLFNEKNKSSLDKKSPIFYKNLDKLLSFLIVLSKYHIIHFPMPKLKK